MTPTPTAMPTDSAVHIPDQTWAQAVSLLTEARRVVLVCHVSPDGDALGSMLALASVLRRRGIDVTCSWGDQRWRLPAAYNWLPGADRCVRPAEVPADPDLLIVLDTGARDRLGVLEPLVEQARAAVVLDHHAHGADIEPALHCVDPHAAATAVVVEELIRRLGEPLDEASATCLYVGLVTDTGGFAHAVTTPAVHFVAARLLAAGVRPDDVSRRIWGTRPLGVVHLLAAALARVRYDATAAAGRGLVWTWTTAEDLTDWGLPVEEADAVMEVIRVTGEADVAVVVKQDIDGGFKISTRSRGATDVGAACAALGGGGHRLAAGFSARGKPEEIVAGFVAALADG